MFNPISEFISGTVSQYQPKVNEEVEVKVDFVNVLPPELILEIFSYFKAEELARCFRVNKIWKVLASDETLWNALTPKIAFGKKEWETYFGDVGQVPPLPKDIHKTLKSRCPFRPEETVEKTHMLVLIPKTVNGKPLTLKTLDELVKAPKAGHATQYRYIWEKIINEHGDQATAQPHWVLMTKDVVPESRNKSYVDQQALIAECAKKTNINYEVPCVLDTAICIFMHSISLGERLFTDKPWTYTRCQEKVQGYHIVVGGFSSAGLDVSLALDDVNVGVAALRKFF